MNILTLIVTIEPATGKTMVRPACELYRSLEQATAQVLRREYKSGIATWIKAMPMPLAAQSLIEPLDVWF